MDIFKVIDDMESFIEKSSHVPFSSKVMLNEEKLFDFLDQIRSAIPYEIKQAQQIIIEKEKFLADGKDEASKMMEDAQREVERKAEESEIVQQAQVYAQALVNRGQETAQEIREGSVSYANDLLGKLEVILEHLAKEIDDMSREVSNGQRELAQDANLGEQYLNESQE